MTGSSAAAATRRLTATAHHEAGHAVVGLRVGVQRRMLQASIVPDAEAGTLGHVKRGGWPRVRDVELGPDRRPRRFYRDLSPEFDEERLVERRLRPDVVALYAGVLAERRWSGRHNWVGALWDMRLADDFIEYIVGSPEQARHFQRFLWQVAKDAVDVHWQDIDRLAEELLVRHSMTGREVMACLREDPATARLVAELLGRATN